MLLRDLWPLEIEDGALAKEWRRLTQVEQWGALGVYPHLISGYYTPALEGRRWLLQEYVEATPLSVWAKERAADPAALMAIGVQVAWALSYLHQHGLTIGALEPEDVLITSVGTARLAGPGFSLATVHRDALQPKAALPFLSLAPELHRGESSTVASDIWAWGLLLARLFGLYDAEKARGAPAGLQPSFAIGLVGRLRSHSFGSVAVTRMLESLFWESLQADPSRRPLDMVAAGDMLHEIYEVFSGELLPRSRPHLDPQLAENKRLLMAIERAETKGETLQDLEKDQDIEAFPAPASLYNRALYRMRNGVCSLEEAVALLDKGVRIRHNGDQEARYLQALLLLEGGEREIALAELTRYSTETPPPFHQPWVLELARDTGVEQSEPAGPMACPGAGGVMALALMNGGNAVAAGTESGKIFLFEATDSSISRTLPALHHGGVRSLAAAEEKGLLLSTGQDGWLRLWNPVDTACLREFPGEPGTVNCVEISSDGRFGFAGGADGRVRVVNLGSGNVVQVLEAHRGPVNGLILFAGGRRLATAGSDRTVRVWNLDGGECLQTLSGHRNLVSAIALSADERLLLSGSWDRELRLWDLNSGASLRVFSGHEGWVTSVGFTTCGRQLVSTSNKGEGWLWDMETGEVVDRFPLTVPTWLQVVRVSSAAGDIFLGTGTGQVEVWRQHKEASRFRAPYLLGRWNDVPPPPFSISFSLFEAQRAMHTGDVGTAYRHLRVTRQREDEGGKFEKLSLWGNLYSLLSISRYQGVWGRLTLGIPNEEILALAVSPDGRYLFGGGRSGQIYQWDIYVGKREWVLRGHEEAITSLAVSGDGRLLVSGSRDSTARVWSIASHQPLHRLAHEYAVMAVAISPDGRLAVSGGVDRQLHSWDTATGRLLCSESGHHRSIAAVAFSDNGRRLLSVGTAGSLKVWAAGCGEEDLSLRAPLSETSACFTPDGSRIVSGGYDNDIHIWNAVDGHLERTLSGHGAKVTGVALSPDGRFIFSVADDATVRIWSMQRGDCLEVLEAPSQPANAIVRDPRWRYLASASRRETVEVWMLDWALDRPREPLPPLDPQALSELLLAPSVMGVRPITA